MLTFKDCLDYCGLTEVEVRAIARRERMDGMAAIAIAYGIFEARAGGPEAPLLADRRQHAEGSPTRRP